MSVEDRLAIQEVIAQYSYTYDNQDAEGFARLFTEDGVFEVFVPVKQAAVLRLESQAAINAWAAKRLETRRGLGSNGAAHDTLLARPAGSEVASPVCTTLHHLSGCPACRHMEYTTGDAWV